MLKNKVYDVLKWIALIALPALSLLIGALGQIWGWVDSEKIVLTISAVATFLGALIGVSSIKYNKENEEGE
jgi:hypothetical protein